MKEKMTFKCLRTLKSARRMAQNVSKKIPFGRIIPNLFFESSESQAFCNYLHDSTFRSAGLNTEKVF